MANVAAATALARSAGVPPIAIREAIRSFKLDAHRIELIAEQDGVLWIDDSKATNPHAAAASLNSFDSIIWVVGGLLKGVEIAPLVKQFAAKLRAVIVIGQDRQPILDAFAKHAPDVQLVEVNSATSAQIMEVVAKTANELAVSGDTVLLAPAAASMDQFKDYADRGWHFAQAVRSVLA
jgi:UDP-N-acetylmuramoylalanine--D-glutamate ligase